MMASWLETQAYWRQHAAETRTRAEKARDPSTHEDLLKIAETCDRLAELAAGTPHSDALKPLALMMAD
jgi:hypothetical protein